MHESRSTKTIWKWANAHNYHHHLRVHHSRSSKRLMSNMPRTAKTNRTTTVLGTQPKIESSLTSSALSFPAWKTARCTAVDRTGRTLNSKTSAGLKFLLLKSIRLLLRLQAEAHRRRALAMKVPKNLSHRAKVWTRLIWSCCKSKLSVLQENHLMW